LQEEFGEFGEFKEFEEFEEFEEFGEFLDSHWSLPLRKQGRE